jgi:hypothetical protein
LCGADLGVGVRVRMDDLLEEALDAGFVVVGLECRNVNQGAIGDR